ncbi:MAG: MBL fold metallo-hydrolase [Myxococcota bacterium]|nr:MBL fold metallo-hydrolase [Myxococcota bacterium]
MKRYLTSLSGNSQKLDGGAMFGNAPKALWTRWARADELNRIDLACRCLLITEQPEQGPPRHILLETGIGAFFEPKLAERFGVQESEHVLLGELERVGLSHQDIDVVVLSHLHFDHAGGLLTPFQEGQESELLFPKATFVVGQTAWERSQHPHPRDRASFIPRIQALLEQSGRLELVDGEHSPTLGPDYRLRRSDGHTPGLVLVEIPSAQGPILFGADLIPGVPWVRGSITMGYDRFPELLIDEKRAVLDELEPQGGRIFFTHDPDTAMARVTRDARGRFAADNAQGALEGLEA